MTLAMYSLASFSFRGSVFSNRMSSSHSFSPSTEIKETRGTCNDTKKLCLFCPFFQIFDPVDYFFPVIYKDPLALWDRLFDVLNDMELVDNDIGIRQSLFDHLDKVSPIRFGSSFSETILLLTESGIAPVRCILELPARKTASPFLLICAFLFRRYAGPLRWIYDADAVWEMLISCSK